MKAGDHGQIYLHSLLLQCLQSAPIRWIDEHGDQHVSIGCSFFTFSTHAFIHITDTLTCVNALHLAEARTAMYRPPSPRRAGRMSPREEHRNIIQSVNDAYIILGFSRTRWMVENAVSLSCPVVNQSPSLSLFNLKLFAASRHLRLAERRQFHYKLAVSAN